MPSNKFFQINFSIGICCSLLSCILSMTIISIILFKRKYHSVTNLLTCNTTVAITLYSIFSLIASILGWKHEWARKEILCQFRAYAFVVSCTILLYSHAIHAISRLFFVLFYKYKILLTWRCHWILILINWLLGICLPLFNSNCYIYEYESRLCTCTTKKIPQAFYGILTSFIIPFSILTIIYNILLNHVKKSTNRLRSSSIPIHLKRQIILLRKLIILLIILLLGGLPYLSLICWHSLARKSPWESFYLLAINLITVATAFVTIALFYLNKDIKKEIKEYLIRQRNI